MKIYGNENNVFILKEIGNRIKETRIAMSIKQRELAEMSGISYSTMQRIESGGNVSIEQLLNVLRSLSLVENIDYLIPEQEIFPSMIVNNVKKKKRVYNKGNKKEIEWKWGDEE